MSVRLVSWMHLDWFFTFTDWPGVSTESDNRNTSHCRQCTSVRRINMASLDQCNNIFLKKRQSWGNKERKTNKQRGQMWEGIALRKIFQGRCLTHLYRFSSLCEVNSTSTLTSPWQPSYDSNVFPQISRSYYYLHLFIEFIITVNVIIIIIIIIIIFNTYVALFL